MKPSPPKRPLLEEDGQLNAGLGSQEGALLDDHILAGPDIQHLDLAGEAGAEGDHAGAAAAGIVVLEHALAGEGLGEHLAETTADGLHVHIGAHPYHGALFCDHFLAVLQMADHHGKTAAGKVITHKIILLYIYMERKRFPL